MKSRYAFILPFLIIALIFSGFAYSHWEKIVTISGTVDTGTVDLIAISASDDDDGIDPGKDKDIADTTVTIDPCDPEKVTITITNAYPSYYVYVHVTIRNVGTVPVKLKQINIDSPDCITVNAWDHEGEQLEPYPDTQYQSDYSIYIHVEQCAEQGATYQITIEFVFWNWNEVP
ncbi:hypothetical protein DRN87_06320 [Candidatus Geothermarchaeota archaeon]|nr:MAG: hypothetical protein DRN87_06320 [Candidatus Geothermarchaeota archaeon]